MSQQMDRVTLDRILQTEDITTLAFPALIRLFQGEEGISDFLPDGVYQIDPRNGDRVLFNSSRARRPHDNLPPPPDGARVPETCAVCHGDTTGVIDVADLSQGFTFINKNLYPSLYPLDVQRASSLAHPEPLPYGLHFLQWTSSLHEADWHNMPLADRIVVLQRLATLEKKLLKDAQDYLPPGDPSEEQIGALGFVLIIKNYGRLVGGSLDHGHQQIALSNVIPRRVHDHWHFEKERGEKFSAYLMRENPSELLIRDYGAALLLVPYFMRRSFEMMLVVKDVSKGHLFQLTAAEITAVAEGWRDAIRVTRWILPRIGKEIAYNVITHNGPGAGLYFEFLPYTQETGGFEHLGLLVCQGNPASAATRIREYLQHA